MTDYYPVLARAVTRLAVNNAQTRQDLYRNTRERFSLRNWNETTQKDLLKRLYVSESTLKRPSSEWRPIRNLDTRQAARRYDIAFMQFASNIEAKSLRPRQGRILPLYPLASASPLATLI